MEQEGCQKKLRDEDREITLHLLLLRSNRDLTKYQVSFCLRLSPIMSQCNSSETELVLSDVLNTEFQGYWLPPMLPDHDLSQLWLLHTHTQTFSLTIFHTCITLNTADLFSLWTNSQCSVSADKLIPIIFKYSSSSDNSRSSLFSIMLSALNIVYSICTRAGRRLVLWSVLFFKQSISDIAPFS